MSDVEELAKRLENESPWFCDLPKAAKLIRTLQAERDRLAKTASDNFAAAVDAQSRAASLAEALDRLTTPRPLEEYHEDYGPVLWYAIPIQEPPYVGWPGDEDWPGYHTHWTPLPDCNLINDRARSLLSQSKPNE